MGRSPIRKQDLTFLSYKALENIYYGLHNLKIPSEMLSVMNIDEIVAKYCATAELKRSSVYPKQHEKFLDMVRNMTRAGGTPAELDEGIVSLVTKMDEIGYSFIAPMAVACKKTYPSDSLSQILRISGLDEGVKRSFANSVFTEYRPSITEDSHNPRSFIDPNRDGMSSDIYVRHIHKLLKEELKQYKPKPKKEVQLPLFVNTQFT